MPNSTSSLTRVKLVVLCQLGDQAHYAKYDSDSFQFGQASGITPERGRDAFALLNRNNNGQRAGVERLLSF